MVQAEEKPPLPPIRSPQRNPLLDGPILKTLLKLAAPNVIALTAGTCVAIAETSYIGRLGVEPLAAMALVFPFVILMMTMSGGAMGGGVASAIARALGADDTERAAALAVLRVELQARGERVLLECRNVPARRQGPVGRRRVVNGERDARRKGHQLGEGEASAFDAAADDRPLGRRAGQPGLHGGRVGSRALALSFEGLGHAEEFPRREQAHP